MKNTLENIMDKSCEMVNRVLGTNISFPKPGKKAWKISGVINGLLGVCLFVGGLVTSLKWLIPLGGLAFIGSIINFNHSKK